jgi:hypothetical protein
MFGVIVTLDHIETGTLNPAHQMKLRLVLTIFVLSFVFAATLRAQVAMDETAAFIQNPTGVHYVFSSNPSRPGTGVFTYVNTNTGDFDIIGVSISGSQAFQGASTVTGRTVTGQISNNSISLTFLGANRSGPLEPTYGSTSSLSGRYYGNFNDPSLGTGALQGFISSGGKFLVYAFLGGSTDLGVGTINTNGDYSVKFASGLTGSGNFAPSNGLATGTLFLSSGTSRTYFLAKGVPARLGNIATRGVVGSGEQVLIGGLIVTQGQKGVLLVARGPSLSSRGVSNPVQNPQIQLFLGSQLIASNNDWGTNANASQIGASGVAPTDSREAALQLTLEPGAYTVIVSSEDASSGIGIVEIYGVGGSLGN